VLDDGLYYFLNTVTNQVEQYTFSIILPFTRNDTLEWIEQIYFYDIKLVAGPRLEDYTMNLVQTHELYPSDATIPLDQWTLDEMIALFVRSNYKYIREVKRLQSLGKPLMSYDLQQDILLPTEIKVGTSLEGGI
jgi:ferritin-like protein